MVLSLRPKSPLTTLSLSLPLLLPNLPPDIAFGGDLRYALKTSTLKDKQTKLKIFDEGRAKFYILQVLDALDYCHTNNILHRDIKPENMLIVTNGYLKLTDFGISMKLEDINACKVRTKL